MSKDDISEVGAILHPTSIIGSMMAFARPSDDDLVHWAENLNAMLRLGYCSKCGLVPAGCHREGCRANAGHESLTLDINRVTFLGSSACLGGIVKGKIVGETADRVQVAVWVDKKDFLPNG